MKPLTLIIQQVKPSLTINKEEGQHKKLEVAKAITVGTSADKDIADLKTKDSEQDTKIATLETKTEALEAREDVAVRFYQGDAPPDVEPLAVGATLLDVEKNRTTGDLVNINETFEYKNTVYTLVSFRYISSAGWVGVKFLRDILEHSKLRDVCVEFNDVVYMIANFRAISDDFDSAEFFLSSASNPIKTKNRIRVEPLLWESEIPAAVAEKKLFQATKTPSGWQVARVLKAENSDIEKAISDLETADTTINQAISDLQTKDTTIEQSITTLETADTTINQSISDLQTKDTTIEQSITTLETKDGEQDTKISTLETKAKALEAREDVAVRFYQGDKPADVEPLAVGATLLDIEEDKISETFIYPNKKFTYKNVIYYILRIEYNPSNRISFSILPEKLDPNADKKLNDLCIEFNGVLYMLAAANEINSSSGVSFFFYFPTAPNPIKAKNRIRVEPLLWESEIPNAKADKKLYSAIKTPAGWQVSRIFRAEDKELSDIKNRVASGGLNQAAVDARVKAGVLDFAEIGNTDTIPNAKLPGGLLKATALTNKTNAKTGTNNSHASMITNRARSWFNDKLILVDVQYDISGSGNENLRMSGIVHGSELISGMDFQVQGAGPSHIALSVSGDPVSRITAKPQISIRNLRIQYFVLAISFS